MPQTGKSSRQPQWDIYEAVVLLDSYLEVLDKKHPKLRVIKRVSADLRQMAVNRGATIDDIFRNENGISYQIKSMESAYVGHKVYVPATKLFAETVDMYRSNRKRYDEVLMEARNLIATKHSNEGAFMIWATSAVSAQRYKWIEENISKIEGFGNKARIITGSIFEIVDDTILESISSTLSHLKLYKMIG